MVTNSNGKSDLLENRTRSSHHWLKFKLNGTDCNRDGIGAKIHLKAGKQQLTQEVRAGSSYLSQSDLRLNFGLGNETRVESILVSWPCGKEGELDTPAAIEPNDLHKGKILVEQ